MNDKQFQKVIRDNGAGTFTFDKETYPGLYYRVSPEGKVAWVYRYRRPGTGKPAQPKMGSYEVDKPKGKPWHMGIADAGAKWTEWRNLIKQGIDPQKQAQQQQAVETAKQAQKKKTKAKSGLTVKKLTTDYVNHISAIQKTGERKGQPLKKSWKPTSKALERALDRHMHLEATELTRGHVTAILQGIRSQGHNVMANRTLAAIRAMYTWAVKKNWPHQNYLPKVGGELEEVPAGAITSNPFFLFDVTDEASRERKLSKSELKRLFKNLPKTDLTQDQQEVLLFTLYTGCRIGEACAMEWAEIHDDEWIQPGRKTKNGHSHTVYLMQPVLDILEGHKGGKYVFSSKTTDSGHLRADTLSKELQKNMPKLKLEPHRIHDYRRTLASWMGDQEIDEKTHDRILNHVIRVGVRATYNTAKYNKPAREAWQQWADYLQELQP